MQVCPVNLFGWKLLAKRQNGVDQEVSWDRKGEWGTLTFCDGAAGSRTHARSLQITQRRLFPPLAVCGHRPLLLFRPRHAQTV